MHKASIAMDSAMRLMIRWKQKKGIRKEETLLGNLHKSLDTTTDMNLPCFKKNIEKDQRPNPWQRNPAQKAKFQ